MLRKNLICKDLYSNFFSSDIRKIYQALYSYYGPQKWWPVKYSKTKFLRRFEISLGAILTQNTSWKNVEKALFNLAQERLIDPERILEIDLHTLMEVIKPSGFYKQKAYYIKSFSKFFLQNDIENLMLRDARKKLLGLKGIGKETADTILLYAYNKHVFVVDSYTVRFFYRIGIINSMNKNKEYEHIRRIVEPFFTTHQLKEFHALIDNHSKTFCKKKPLCPCFLAKKKNIYK